MKDKCGFVDTSYCNFLCPSRETCWIRRKNSEIINSSDRDSVGNVGGTED